MARAMRQDPDGVAPADADSPGVEPRAYDFRTGTELSRETLSQLRACSERLTAALGRIMSVYLDCPTRFEVAAMGACPLEQFLSEAPAHAALALVGFVPAAPGMVWQIGDALTGPIVNRMLGGPAEALERAPTALEAGLLRTFTQEMVDIWATTWDRLAAQRPQVQEVVSESAALQGKIAEGETVMVTMAAEIAGAAGEMRVCLPVASAQRLVGETDAGRARDRRVNEERLRLVGGRVVVPVSVVVHQLRMPLSRAVALQAGDVIPLGKPVREPMTVAVRGKPKFLAETGVVGGRLAAKLIGPSPPARRR